MGKATSEFVPISWVSKQDLLLCRPDLKEQVEALDGGDVGIIADKIGDALQETYWLAMNIVLADYLGVEEAPD